jgi:hypothetical protein
MWDWRWRRLQQDQLYVLCAIPNTIIMIKAGRTRWTEHIATMGEGRNTHAGFWWGNLKDRDHLEELEVDGKTI